ncbi:hypothetical protein [Methylocella tundrae]|jgi:hypothetical protein|uniref:hypothetical protein n=1 Tax=Methylocella tundrae TaxID=227605 RepID=UPI002ADEE55A|nr:hypothetical protein [Methylocella tundrae]WPP02749.1 hypothetical protein SIN04_00130 [Methylocella tundrae]
MKFRVVLVEEVTYEVEVEADDEASAGDAARKRWEESENPTEEFSGQGAGVEVDDVEKINS